MDWLRRTLPWLFVVVVLVGYTPLLHAKDVTLSWDASPSQISGYIVTVSLSEVMLNPIQSDTVGNVLTLTIQGLEDTQEHFFGVKAYDAQGNESVFSNVVKSPAVEVPPYVLPKLDFIIDVELLK